MNAESMKPRTKTDLVALAAVFGSPPLLSTESLEHYYELVDQLTEVLHPNDGLELLLVRQVWQESWKILRYERHQTLAINRGVRQIGEFQAAQDAERDAKRSALSKNPAETAGRPRTELSQMRELCQVIEASVEDIDALADRARAHRLELMNDRALEKGIIYQEQLDRLISAATKRRKDALEQLKTYRALVGRRLRQLTDKILDAEIVEPDSLGLIGENVGSDAIGN
jgi:hypothetical protein